MARPARFERATLCLEGRRSIQLSYGRVGYCNYITELEASVEWTLQPHSHCAQFCAHLAETWQQKQHPRTGEHNGQRSRWNYVPRFELASMHRSRTPPVASKTCASRNRERTGAHLSSDSWQLRSLRSQTPRCAAFSSSTPQRGHCASAQATASLLQAFQSVPRNLPRSIWLAASLGANDARLQSCHELPAVSRDARSPRRLTPT